MAHRTSRQSIVSVVAASLGVLTAGAHAVTTTSTVPINLAVNYPICSVSNNNASIALPPVLTASTSFDQWRLANGIVVPGVGGGTEFTSDTFDQTALITCNTMNTMIQSFVVQPSGSATVSPSAPEEQFLVDGSATPQKAFAGAMSVGAEQLAVNGNPTLYSYRSNTGGTPNPYVTPFPTSTASGPNWTAAVMWRPYVYSTNPAALAGLPTGGAYLGSMDIVVNY